MKRDINYVAKVEQAIAKKYGDITIQNPRAFWNQEKEKDYLEQIKILQEKERNKNSSEQKVEKDGFLIAKKLFNKESDRTCPACFEYSFDPKDDLYMNRYDCCSRCYVQFVEGREERWSNLTERVEFLSSYYNRGER